LPRRGLPDSGQRGDRIPAGIGAAVGAQFAARYVELDVRREAHWERSIGDVVARHGRLDVLVNNAGYLKPGLSIEDTTLEEWRAHFAVNSDGAFLGCKHAILAMKRSGGGAIVNVSSAVAVRMHWQSPAYGVSKSAILATTRVAALHCNHHRYGIRVNAVLPGPIDTEMMRSNVASVAEFEQMARFLRVKYGMARIGVPEDIAGIVTFLASEQASYVTGAAFTVDGGQTA